MPDATLAFSQRALELDMAADEAAEAATAAATVAKQAAADAEAKAEAHETRSPLTCQAKSWEKKLGTRISLRASPSKVLLAWERETARSQAEVAAADALAEAALTLARSAADKAAAAEEAAAAYRETAMREMVRGTQALPCTTSRSLSAMPHLNSHTGNEESPYDRVNDTSSASDLEVGRYAAVHKAEQVQKDLQLREAKEVGERWEEKANLSSSHHPLALALPLPCPPLVIPSARQIRNSCLRRRRLARVARRCMSSTTSSGRR